MTEPRGAKHCETTTLGVLLRHEGLDLSEPMLFGLGAGLSFVYWDGKGLDFPFLGGRVKPFELTRNLAGRLGLELVVKETGSARRAWENVAAELDAGRPVGLQVDSYHLEYFTSKVHFGGHVVAMYGHDGRDAHLVDTEQQGGAVTTSLASLAAARAERGPMTARNRSFTLAVRGEPAALQGPLAREKLVREAMVPALTACADAFLHPPIANLGHRGVDKAAALVPGWQARADRPEIRLPQAARMMELAGTGGALFRNLYRDFLGECVELLDDPRLRVAHAKYAEAARGWTEVARLVAAAGTSGEAAQLVEAGALLRELAALERSAMGELTRLGELSRLGE
ncbi:BtrH N-terminal domain-containing protein [Kitasatospora sp. NPDC058201]|uniref:BtrH N-terminal domain-containing protein n=1 Tax=unclassified Kitasatospora TaxID=2633591 RepID=UPI00365F8CCF